jgi:murein DD-endopeptidase MepM/ murein hydrolase activator NlpD
MAAFTVVLKAFLKKKAKDFLKKKAKNTVKKRISRNQGDSKSRKGTYIAIVVCFVLVLLVLVFPFLVIENIGNSFLDWFKKSNSIEVDDYPMSQQINDWLDNSDVTILLNETLYTSDDIKKYIEAEKSTVLRDVELTLERRVRKYRKDGSDPERSFKEIDDYKEDYDYKLKLLDFTYPYRLPWQVMLSKNAIMYQEYSNKIKDKLVSQFRTEYYGTVKSLDRPLKQSDFKKRTKYKYYKTVTKTTRYSTPYTIHHKDLEALPDSEYYYDEEGNLIIDSAYDDDEIEIKDSVPYLVKRWEEEGQTDYKIVAEADIPLPYFDKYVNIYETVRHEYEYQTTTEDKIYKIGSIENTVTTEITEPVLINTETENNVFNYFVALQEMEITTEVSQILYMVRKLPGGQEAGKLLELVEPFSYLNVNDYYFGVELGIGNYVITPGAKYIYPIKTSYIRVCSGYGMRLHPVHKVYKMHTGIDLDCSQETPILAAGAGTVTVAKERGGYGNLIVIEHDDGFQTYYAHLLRFLVEPGDEVNKGTVIALSGGDPNVPGAGTSTGPHLHFEVRQDYSPLDPAPYIGLVPNIDTQQAEHLQFKSGNTEKLKNHLRDDKNSVLAGDSYFNKVMETAEKYNLHPALLFAIAGYEQDYAVNDLNHWLNYYSSDELKEILEEAGITQAGIIGRISANPYNVGGKWYETNRSFSDSTDLLAITLINLMTNCPDRVDILRWINQRGYNSEDLNWWRGVGYEFKKLKRKY